MGLPLRAALAALLALGLVRCSKPLHVAAFAGASPQFDPVVFFTGGIASWGVMEDRGGEPTAVVVTSGRGVAEGTDGVHFPQTVRVGNDKPMLRDWHLRRVAPGRFTATANDIVGTASGTAEGPAFHWRWTLALRPGQPLWNIGVEQWWYLQPDGSMLNRSVFTKFGFIVAEASEHFTRVP